MIQKRVKYFKVEDVTVVKYGYGTIKMTPAENTDNGIKSLLLKSHEARPIGSVEKNTAKNSDEWEPEVVISFKNKESLHALIDSLKEVEELFND